MPVLESDNVFPGKRRLHVCTECMICDLRHLMP